MGANHLSRAYNTWRESEHEETARGREVRMRDQVPRSRCKGRGEEEVRGRGEVGQRRGGRTEDETKKERVIRVGGEQEKLTESSMDS